MRFQRLERPITALERLREYGSTALPLIMEENDAYTHYRDAYERSCSEPDLLKRLEYIEMLPQLHAELLEISAQFHGKR